MCIYIYILYVHIYIYIYAYTKPQAPVGGMGKTPSQTRKPS